MHGEICYGLTRKLTELLLSKDDYSVKFVSNNKRSKFGQKFNYGTPISLSPELLFYLLAKYRTYKGTYRSCNSFVIFPIRERLLFMVWEALTCSDSYVRFSHMSMSPLTTVKRSGPSIPILYSMLDGTMEPSQEMLH